VQDVAFVDDQSRLVVPPDTVEVGDAERNTSGAGAGVTTSVADAEVVPPEPVQVRV